MQIKATITMQSGETISLELDPVQAPNTVRNFVSLARKGFYDGLIFHRIIPGFMIQGGCPDGTGMGGPGYCIPGEFSRNGHKNAIRHNRGVISMARAMQPDSAGSQFFIMHQDSPHLDGQYAAFGRVTEGLDTVDAIAAVNTGANDRPREEQKIQQIVIETDSEADQFLTEPETV
jgi:peptidyl-prolyl cis-trans isomerase B (cyclophilin B)